MRRREFITLLGGAAARGRSRRARSSRGSCRPSGSWARTPAAGSQLLAAFVSDCANLAGSRGATSRSSIAGRRDAPSARRDRGRVRPAQGRYHRHVLAPHAVLAAKQATRSSRSSLRGGRSGRHRHGRKSGATGRQCHWAVTRSTDLAGKRLELLREVMPGLRRLAILAMRQSPIVLEIGEVQAAARNSPRSRHVLKSGEARISRPRSRRSRAAPTRFMSSPTRSSTATGCASIRWRCGARLPTMHGLGSSSKRAV